MGFQYNPITGMLDLTGSGAGPTTVTSSTVPSVDNTIVRFDGTSGTAVQGSTATISDAGVLTADNIIDSGLTASRAVVTDGSKQLTSATTTAAEIEFVSGVTSAIQTQLNSKANYNKITVVAAQAGTSTTYNTLQDAFNAIPAGTTATERRQSYIVHIPSGTYDEDVTVATNNRSIIVVPHGVVSLGLMTGSAWGTGGTARSLTLSNDGTATVNSIRSSFSIVQEAPLADVLTSNQANISAFKVSGDVILTAAIGISSEFHFDGLEVFGNFDTSGYSGNCNVYTKFSRYRGTFGGTPTRLQNAYRVTFGGLVTVGVYSMINECVISAGFTTSSGTPDIQPSGITNTNFSGTFTGPSGSAKFDTNTNYWFITNGASLAGGATKTYLDALATSTETGVLSSTDWSTFNSKQPAGNYITDLTGDATASGPGSVALTLATVNGNVGSFGTATQVGSFTVNAKGLITAASNTSIQIAESQVTNLVSDLAAKQSNVLTDAHILVGSGSNIATDVAVSGDITLANTGAVTLNTVNGNVGSFGSSTSIPSFTVNAKGLITAASGNAVVAPAGTLSGTTLNATVVSSSLTSVGTITSGTWNGSTIDIAHGGTNSTAALNNNRVMQSSGGAIVEAAAITASRALISDANGIPTHSAVTSTELGHVSGVTSAIQTQLDARLLESAGDINETSFTAADNQAVAANVTGLAFANGVVRSFEVILSIVRGATYAQYKLNGVQGAASWYFGQTYLGDDTGLAFTITTAGQIQYTSSSTGDTAAIRFRALTTSVA